MKHFVAAVVLLFSCTAVYGANDFKGQLQLLGGGNLSWQNDDLFDEKVITNLRGAHAGLAMLFFYGNMGFSDHFNLFFPVQTEVNYNDGTEFLKFSDYKFSFGLENLLGFAYKLRAGPFEFPISVGIHIMSQIYNFHNEEEVFTDTTIGIGINLDFHFYPKNNFYLFFGITGAYDFFGTYNIKYGDTVEIKHGIIEKWVVTPNIGVGFVF